MSYFLREPEISQSGFVFMFHMLDLVVEIRRTPDYKVLTNSEYTETPFVRVNPKTCRLIFSQASPSLQRIPKLKYRHLHELDSVIFVRSLL
jgi:hypothetical protein